MATSCFDSVSSTEGWRIHPIEVCAPKQKLSNMVENLPTKPCTYTREESKNPLKEYLQKYTNLPPFATPGVYGVHLSTIRHRCRCPEPC